MSAAQTQAQLRDTRSTYTYSYFLILTYTYLCLTAALIPERRRGYEIYLLLIYLLLPPCTCSYILASTSRRLRYPNAGAASKCDGSHPAALRTLRRPAGLLPAAFPTYDAAASVSPRSLAARAGLPPLLLLSASRRTRWCQSGRRSSLPRWRAPKRTRSRTSSWFE